MFRGRAKCHSSCQSKRHVEKCYLVDKKKTFQNENAESKHAIAMVRLMSIDISG